MAKKTKRHAPKPAVVNALGWRRQSGGSARFKNISDYRYPIGATISNRQMSNLKRETRLGHKMSKEEYTKKVDKGELSYADAATKKRQTNAKNSRVIREFLPEVAPKDKAIALKYYQTGYHGLTPAEKARFRKMYDVYPPDSVRQALGSAPKNIGSFRFAA